MHSQGGVFRRAVFSETYRRCRSASSSGRTSASRRAIARNRSIGVLARSAFTAASTTALSADSVARRRGILARQLGVGKPATGSRRRNFAEAGAVIVFSLVEAKCLLIKISAKME